LTCGIGASSVGVMTTHLRAPTFRAWPGLTACALLIGVLPELAIAESGPPLATTAPIAAATGAVVPDKRIDLFNGKDFSGWNTVSLSNSPPAETWSVVNGVIHCTGRPNGYLYTARSYRDYKLTVEWRFVKVAHRADNTGLFVHVQPSDKTEGWIWPRCIECQGQHGNQGDFILMTGAAFKGYEAPATYKIVKSTQPRNEKPVGEWNRYEIVCRGDTLKALVNGKLMNEAAACTVSAGAIALQSEGGEFEVRQVYLEPVSD
jgi:hypothetical protein